MGIIALMYFRNRILLGFPWKTECISLLESGQDKWFALRWPKRYYTNSRSRCQEALQFPHLHISEHYPVMLSGGNWAGLPSDEKTNPRLPGIWLHRPQDLWEKLPGFRPVTLPLPEYGQGKAARDHPAIHWMVRSYKSCYLKLPGIGVYI